MVEAWYGMVDVCKGAPVAVIGGVLTDRHDLAPCAANGLHRATMSGNDVIEGMGTLERSMVDFSLRVRAGRLGARSMTTFRHPKPKTRRIWMSCTASHSSVLSSTAALLRTL